MEAAPPVDCDCVSNLPALQIACPGIVPDLCAIATHCFSTNVLAGSCNQVPPPGVTMRVGTNFIVLNVLDPQGNLFQCLVPFIVTAPLPPPGLTLACSSNKTVESGSGWSFDPPVALTAGCGVTVTVAGQTTTRTAAEESRSA